VPNVEFDDYDDYDEEDEDDMFDCGMDSSGLSCSMAGSEDCDFECPNRDAMFARLKQRAKSKK
jgi:hypothetical protein